MIDTLGLAGFFVLHFEILELARQVAFEVRGTGHGAGAAAARPRPRLVGLLDRVLPRGALAHRPDRERPRDRPVPARGHHRAAGHRHRLPPRYPRAAAAADPRALWPRPRGARRDVPELQGEAIDQRARHGTRATRGGARPGRQRLRGLGRRRAPSPRTSASRSAPSACEHTRWKWLAKLADEAYGLPRYIGQHPGGMVISTRPLIDCVPIVPSAMPGRQMVQWDKDSCSDAGFLKIDILGLGMLSAVERCVELIAKRTGERVDLSRIPFDDPDDVRARSRKRTRPACSRSSRRAQMGSLRRTRPATLADLTIQVALVRPGPIVGGAVNTYIERRQALLRRPELRGPVPAPLATRVPRGDARHDRLPGPGHRSLPSVRRVQRGAGREPQTRHEPQALRGGDEAPPRAVPRRRAADASRRQDEVIELRLEHGRRLRRLRVPQVSWRRVRPARLPVDMAARAPPLRVPLRAALRAADGLLPTRHA